MMIVVFQQNYQGTQTTIIKLQLQIELSTVEPKLQTTEYQITNCNITGYIPFP